MARHNDTSAGKKRPVEQYDHKGKKRANNPPVGLVDSKSDGAEAKKTYAYDPHLDPTLVWAGKAERTSFEIPTVSLHVHERIDPEASKDIDELNWPGVTTLKAQMNADLQTEDLKKKRTSNESFWLIGQPDVVLRRSKQTPKDKKDKTEL
jgi:hypothetical protein